MGPQLHKDSACVVSHHPDPLLSPDVGSLPFSWGPPKGPGIIPNSPVQHGNERDASEKRQALHTYPKAPEITFSDLSPKYSIPALCTHFKNHLTRHYLQGTMRARGFPQAPLSSPSPE